MARIVVGGMGLKVVEKWFAARFFEGQGCGR
jgi:hypothetical protein